MNGKTHDTGYKAWMFLAFLTATMLPCACTINQSDTTVVTYGNMTYRGETVNGKREGLGALYAGDSLVYSGAWHNNMRHGKGWAIDSLGRRVDAIWDHDTIVTGTRHDSLGVYRGQFDHRLMAHGHGTYHDAEGGIFEGVWKHDKRNGFGFSSQRSLFRVGEWKNNVYKGERLSYSSDRIYGIDISKHQHVKKKKHCKIFWDKLRVTHLGTLSNKCVNDVVDYKISFIFIKSTEGTSVVNKFYKADYAAARAHGYPVGSYHFFSYHTSGSAQAATFLRHSYFKKGDLPPVLDLEPLPSHVKKMGGAHAMWRRVRAWLYAVERKTGMRPILYVSQMFVNKYLDEAPDIKSGYPVWIARYGEYKPDVKLWIWQLAPDGRVLGIHGDVDINIFNGYSNEFKQWLEKVRMK